MTPIVPHLPQAYQQSLPATPPQEQGRTVRREAYRPGAERVIEAEWQPIPPSDYPPTTVRTSAPIFSEGDDQATALHENVKPALAAARYGQMAPVPRMETGGVIDMLA